jgi:hypothetical protein
MELKVTAWPFKLNLIPERDSVSAEGWEAPDKNNVKARRQANGKPFFITFPPTVSFNFSSLLLTQQVYNLLQPSGGKKKNAKIAVRKLNGFRLRGFPSLIPC